MKKILILLLIILLLPSSVQGSKRTDHKKAIEAAIEADKKYSENLKNEQTLDNLDYAELLLRAEKANEDGNYSKALEYHDEIIKRVPESDTAYEWRGLIHLQQYQNYTQAISDFSMAIKYNKSAPRFLAYYGRGFARFCLKDYDGAIYDFTTAIAIMDKDSNKDNDMLAQTYFYRATCYMRVNNRKASIDDSTMSIKLKPKNPDAFLNRGLAKQIMYAEQRSAEGVQSAATDLSYAREQFLQVGDIENYHMAIKAHKNALLTIAVIRKEKGMSYDKELYCQSAREKNDAQYSELEKKLQNILQERRSKGVPDYLIKQLENMNAPRLQEIRNLQNANLKKEGCVP